MRITNHAGLSAEALAKLESELPAHGTLLEVVRWSAAQIPPVVIANVVTQDEFTHDLVLRWQAGLFLVYGAT